MGTKGTKKNLPPKMGEKTGKARLDNATLNAIAEGLGVDAPVAVAVTFRHLGDEAVPLRPEDVTPALLDELKKLVVPKPRSGDETNNRGRFDVRHFFGSDEVLKGWRERRWEGAGSIFDLSKGLERAGFDTESNKVKTVEQMDKVAEEVRTRNAVIKQREAKRNDSAGEDPAPCESPLHQGERAPFTPKEWNVVNRATMEVVCHQEGKKKDEPVVAGQFTLLPEDPGNPEGALLKVLHCEKCMAMVNAIARKAGINQPWYSSTGAEGVLYFHEHPEEFKAKNEAEAASARVEAQVRGGIGKLRTRRPSTHRF
ncbi:MAG: hypothetical protein HYS74_02975 [Parcubacteria group bacterium]|nr:hypothetical protein [Parcubacteria group bacterium]